MTLNQLYDLNEDELAMALYVVNVIAPPVVPKMTFEPRHLTWFRHEYLIKKFLDAFPKLNPDGHATYVSLMQKLGVCIQIQQPPSPNENTNETSSSIAPSTSTEPTPEEVTGSIGCPSSQSLSSDEQNITGSNDAGEPTRPLEV